MVNLKCVQVIYQQVSYSAVNKLLDPCEQQSDTRYKLNRFCCSFLGKARHL